jgi:putative nucleotidyltransferase-like protein
MADVNAAVEAHALRDFVERFRAPRPRSELDAAAVELLDAFAAVDVNALLLKGPVLARVLYTAGEYRGYCDVDLLVSPADLPAARRVLVELGYADASKLLGVVDVGRVVHAETWFRRTGGVMVDLHRWLPGCDAPPQVAWDALAPRRVFIEVEGRDAPVLDRAGLALHLALHATQRGPEDDKAIDDLERGLERWPPEVWREAAALARAVEALPAFAAGLRLLPAGAARARDLGLPPTGELDWTILHRATRPRGTFHLQALAEARSVRERVEVLRRSLLPTRRWIAWQYPGAGAGGARMLVAYARHLLRTPLWAVRAWRFRERARRAAR